VHFDKAGERVGFARKAGPCTQDLAMESEAPGAVGLVAPAAARIYTATAAQRLTAGVAVLLLVLLVLLSN